MDRIRKSSPLSFVPPPSSFLPFANTVKSASLQTVSSDARAFASLFSSAFMLAVVEASRFSPLSSAPSPVSLSLSLSLCSVCLYLHHSCARRCQLGPPDQIGAADDLLSCRIQLPRVVCAAAAADSPLPTILCWCKVRWPRASSGLSAVLACLLFVAWDWGTDGALRFPLQRVSATKCSIMQDGFYCRNLFYFACHISTNKYYQITFLGSLCTSMHTGAFSSRPLKR